MNILLLSMSKLSVREGIIEESKCKWTDENNTEHESDHALHTGICGAGAIYA